MFQEIGSSRFVHFEESETTRSNPETFARQARITLLSAAPRVVATAARDPAPASTTTAIATLSKRGRGTRKAFCMTLLSRWAFSGSREVVTCLCRLRAKSATSRTAPLTPSDVVCSLE